MNNLSGHKRHQEEPCVEEEELGSSYTKSYDFYGIKEEDQLHLIEGYTNHLVDKEYITMMHQHLKDKISFLVGKLLIFHNECKKRHQADTNPKEIDKVETCIIAPLRAVKNKIMEYESIVLHALDKKVLGSALHITESQDALNIIHTMCRTSRIELTMTLHYGDNDIQYAVFFDKERLDFVLY